MQMVAPSPCVGSPRYRRAISGLGVTSRIPLPMPETLLPNTGTEPRGLSHLSFPEIHTYRQSLLLDRPMSGRWLVVASCRRSTGTEPPGASYRHLILPPAVASSVWLPSRLEISGQSVGTAPLP